MFHMRSTYMSCMRKTVGICIRTPRQAPIDGSLEAFWDSAIIYKLYCSCFLPSQGDLLLLFPFEGLLHEMPIIFSRKLPPGAFILLGVLGAAAHGAVLIVRKKRMEVESSSQISSTTQRTLRCDVRSQILPGLPEIIQFRP